MLQNILKLDGTMALDKNDQKQINGGRGGICFSQYGFTGGVYHSNGYCICY